MPSGFELPGDAGKAPHVSQEERHLLPKDLAAVIAQARRLMFKTDCLLARLPKREPVKVSDWSQMWRWIIGIGVGVPAILFTRMCSRAAKVASLIEEGADLGTLSDSFGIFTICCGIRQWFKKRGYNSDPFLTDGVTVFDRLEKSCSILEKQEHSLTDDPPPHGRRPTFGRRVCVNLR